MKFISAILATTLLLVGEQFGFSQDFVNLNFENATIVFDHSSSYYPNAISATDAIPGWTAIGFLSPNDILYNGVSLGATSVSLLSTNAFPPPAFPAPLDGRYSIDLYGGAGGGIPTGASISQTGLVPVDAASIIFIAQPAQLAETGSLVISLGGQNIPFFAISAGPNYTVYGGDISAFAGQSEQLMFTALPGNNNYWEIDDIWFSSSPVPEPSEFALAALGTFLFGFRRWRNSSR